MPHADLFLELTRPDGHREYHPVTQLPFRLGRGFQNELVLADDYASARHLEISRDDDGQLWIEDLGSENGTFLAPSQRQRLRVTAKRRIGSGEAVHLGRSRIVLWPADAPVAPALPLEHSQRSWLGQLLLTLLPLFVLLLMTVAGAYWQTVNDEDFSELISMPVGVAVFVGVWAAVWAFLGRLFMHRAAYLAHLSLICAMAVAMLATEVLLDMLLYSLESADAPWKFLTRRQGLIEDLVFCVVLFWLLCGHLRHAFPLTPRRRRLIAAVLPVGILVVPFVQGYFSEDKPSYFEARADLMLPVAMRLGPVKPPEELLDTLTALEQEVAVPPPAAKATAMR